MVNDRADAESRVQPPSDLIQSVSRALRVLEVVGTRPDGMNPKQVARRSGLKLSTTYHLLRTLAYEGYLVRRPSGDYALGLEIADRFRDLVASLGRPPHVANVLRHVATATGHTAYLARLIEGRVTISMVSEAPGSPHLEDLIPGFDEAAHATALGKALLSTLTPADRHAYVRHQGLRSFTPRTVQEEAALDAELAAATAGGVFVESGQYRDGVACAAVLVRTGQPEDPWWSLAVSAAADAFVRRRGRLEDVLATAAADLAA